MGKTAALLLTLALALPAVARAHTCEAEVAKMKTDLDAIRGAIASIEAVPPSDMQRQMLSGARGKYDLELRRTTEAQARCERLVREESPGATPATPTVPAPLAASAAASPVETARPPVPPPPGATAPQVPATPASPCLTGCGKDTDCKGDRICVNAACQDPPPR